MSNIITLNTPEIEAFKAVVQAALNQYWSDNKLTYDIAPTVEAEDGQKFIKFQVVANATKSRSIHCFIAKCDFQNRTIGAVRQETSSSQLHTRSQQGALAETSSTTRGARRSATDTSSDTPSNHTHHSIEHTMKRNDTYWNKNGQLQSEYEILSAQIPEQGECPADRPELEKLRRASNAYHDLYNNGLCNLADEFSRVFGFSAFGAFGKTIEEDDVIDFDKLANSSRAEDAISIFIERAALEWVRVSSKKTVAEKAASESPQAPEEPSPSRNLPSRPLQITAISFPPTPNSGDCSKLIALCEDGSIWEQWHSMGYANVPNDGLWYPINLPAQKIL